MAGQQGRRRDDARELARQLRRQGWTYDEVARELGVSRSSCSLWLRDLPRPEPPPPPRAAPAPPGPSTAAGEDHDDDQHDGDHEDDREDDRGLARRLEARRLRRDGLLLAEIAELLGVALTTASRWCAGLPAPVRARQGRDPEEVRAEQRQRWDRVLAEREQERQAVRSRAAGSVGALSRRELELMGVVLYWAEGAKSKPYARRERVTFTNSDPGAVRLWLRYLDLVGFPQEHRRYQVAIHVSADVGRAQAAWAEVVGVPVERFQPPTLKRHQPVTNRKNVEQGYTGCLVVRCVQSRALYQRIEGTWQGIMAAAAAQAAAPSALV